MGKSSSFNDTNSLLFPKDLLAYHFYFLDKKTNMKQSAGILLFKREEKELKFFLVHSGGPFFAKKDAGWWTIPKGEINLQEDFLSAAVREFEEETGNKLSGDFIPLRPITQKAGKKVFCWAIEGDVDATKIVSNTFEMMWPPKSGKMQIFPEIDKAGWFSLDEAKKMIMESQISFLDELVEILKQKQEFTAHGLN